ncbi:MAG: hypothetical protein K0U98_16095 [Deltaproteobacteria bacterium]|nr:hypothetical protein [Deltaproteobacteria bacterium]
MRRAWPLQLLLTLLLVAFAGLVWLTYHPEAEILTQAEDIPVVGSWATHLRRIYLPKKPRIESPREPGSSRVDEASPQSIPAIELRGLEARPFEWFRDGAPIFDAPLEGAQEIGQVVGIRRLVLWEQREGWAAVRTKGVHGWIHLDASSILNEPPLGRATKPVLALDGRAPDPDRLRRALEKFPELPKEMNFGPYKTYTDLDNSTLLAFLNRVAENLETSYRERTLLAPRGQAHEVVLLFAHEASYREFQQTESRLEGLDSRGHAETGMAALFVGESDTSEIAATLVHELAHLLNRRSIGPALPPWLDEGIAEDLASSRLAADGTLQLGSLRGQASLQGTVVSYSGAFAALRQLQERASLDDLPPLRKLVDQDWHTFVADSHRTFNYAHSALWVRFLFSGDPVLPTSFREFLDAVAKGEPVHSAHLEQRLDRSWAQLDREFRAWLEGEYVRWLPLLD